MSTDPVKVIRVSATTSTQDLGAAISHALYDNQKLVLRAIGAAAVNQAVKGMAKAATYVAGRALSLACRPGFETVIIDGAEKTAVVFHVFVL